MPVMPTNCFICKTYWQGSTPICDDCTQLLAVKAPTYQPITPNIKLDCIFCGSNQHEIANCLDAQLHAQKLQAQQARDAQLAQMKAAAHIRAQIKPRGRSKPFANYNYQPPLAVCPSCRGNYLIESKAGSVCSSCKTVVHNPCRSCTSSKTIGIKGDGVQFIECQDCQHME